MITNYAVTEALCPSLYNTVFHSPCSLCLSWSMRCLVYVVPYLGVSKPVSYTHLDKGLFGESSFRIALMSEFCKHSIALLRR